MRQDKLLQERLNEIEYFDTWLVAFDPHHRKAEALKSLYQTWSDRLLYQGWKKSQREQGSYEYRMEFTDEYPLTLAKWIRTPKYARLQREFLDYLSKFPKDKISADAIHPAYQEVREVKFEPMALALFPYVMIARDPSHRSYAKIDAAYRDWISGVKLSKGHDKLQQVAPWPIKLSPEIELAENKECFVGFLAYLDKHPAVTKDLDPYYHALHDTGGNQHHFNSLQALYLSWRRSQGNPKKLPKKLLEFVIQQLQATLPETGLLALGNFKAFVAGQPQSLSLQLDLTYLLEKVDFPQHRDVAEVHRLFTLWNEEVQNSTKAQGLVSDLSGDLSSIREKNGLSKTDLKFFLISHASKENVARIDYYYHPHYQNPKTKLPNQLDSLSNRVYFINGYMVDAYGFPITTLSLKGKQPHYAAYVVDAEGHFYIHPHIQGKFHHSSFLAGRKVLCAGMIKVVDGKVRVINSKSGHYKPLNHNLALATHLLQRQNAFQDDKNFGHKWKITRLFLSFLDGIGLYDKGPKVSLAYRPEVTRKLAHYLQKTSFPPFYWLGRALDGIAFSYKFSLASYDELYVKDKYWLSITQGLENIKQQRAKYPSVHNPDLPASAQVDQVAGEVVGAPRVASSAAVTQPVNHAYIALFKKRYRREYPEDNLSDMDLDRLAKEESIASESGDVAKKPIATPAPAKKSTRGWLPHFGFAAANGKSPEFPLYDRVANGKAEVEPSAKPFAAR